MTALHLSDLAMVALGSLIGGPARYFLAGRIGAAWSERLPWGTIIINMTGAFLIGLLAAGKPDIPSLSGLAWPFLVTGILGSYTTVSSFSLQTLALLRERAYARAGLNISLSVILSLGAVALGYFAGPAIWGAMR